MSFFSEPHALVLRGQRSVDWRDRLARRAPSRSEVQYGLRVGAAEFCDGGAVGEGDDGRLAALAGKDGGPEGRSAVSIFGRQQVSPRVFTSDEIRPVTTILYSFMCDVGGVGGSLGFQPGRQSWMLYLIFF